LTFKALIWSGKTPDFIDFGFLDRLWQATFAASTFKTRTL